MKTGIELITEEREKQINKHGFTGEHHALRPEFYQHNQLISAANYLMLNNTSHATWHPENWDKEWFYRLCEKPYKERLVIASALIAAELDRLNYLEFYKE